MGKQLLKSIIGACTAVFLVILLTTCTTSRAEEPYSITFGGVSHHLVSEDTTTWFHNAVILQKGDLLAGYTKNSYGQDSFVAAYKVWEERKPSTLTELSLGVVRGYDKCYGRYSDEQRSEGKSKVWGCFLPLVTITYLIDSPVQPQLSLWGDALVLTGKYTF